MRRENEKLVDQLRHRTSLLNNKYQDLERNTLSKVELTVKRIKKIVGYLSNLSVVMQLFGRKCVKESEFAPQGVRYR
jgi:hypothetical protein